MKKSLLLGVAFAALAFAAPASAELKFKPGEDARFHWDNFEALKKVDLKGETLSIFGPWRGEDEALVRSSFMTTPPHTSGWVPATWASGLHGFGYCRCFPLQQDPHEAH